ncbi:uncharacterized protein LOC142524677 [Primulina tabacum]|uniref:uncharacterized protein LOC142524677 n=1 Tax=Primulina tabacum TaxID=48773 RepID=UPI003F5A6842
MSLRPGSRADVRKKNYKIGVDVEEVRRRREDNLVEIRKSKREDNLLKKRREGLPNGSLPQQLFPLDPSQSPAAIEKKGFIRWNLAMCQHCVCIRISISRRLSSSTAASAFYCMTFKAQNAESDECSLFRGAVYVVGGPQVLLCEIKNNHVHKLFANGNSWTDQND